MARCRLDGLPGRRAQQGKPENVFGFLIITYELYVYAPV